MRGATGGWGGTRPQYIIQVGGGGGWGQKHNKADEAHSKSKHFPQRSEEKCATLHPRV